MMFAREIRRQLSQIMQFDSKGLNTVLQISLFQRFQNKAKVFKAYQKMFAIIVSECFIVTIKFNSKDEKCIPVPTFE